VAFNFNIPRSSTEVFSSSLDIGECVYVLGANGTGKSSLMHHLFTINREKAYRMLAHRQNWLSSDSISMSPQQKRQTESNIKSHDMNPESRWRDDNSAYRSMIAIYDLIEAENTRSREIASAVDSSNIDLARELSKNDAPIKQINELLRLSNIPIEISIRANEQIMAAKSGGNPYGVSQLSDGERNVLLIASTVLTVPPESLILIDEPERHLHRSIISPLLNLLFSKRFDCSFIISTHDITLPSDSKNAKSLLVRGCEYSGQTVMSWDFDLIPSESTLDENVKQEILGSRRKIVFVEGERNSLDKNLYSLLFSEASIISKSSCRDVEQSVVGIRNTSELHRVQAFGIVDNDRRTQEDIENLIQKGVYAVSVHSVESIYYHPDIQNKLALRHAGVTGENTTDLLRNAKNAVLSSVTPHIQRMSERVVDKSIRDEIDKKRPKQSDITIGGLFNLTIDISQAVSDEKSRLENYIRNEDILEIISKYPIRETPALSGIAYALGFRTRDQYEKAVIKLMSDDEDALRFARSLFGTLTSDISAN
jgi:ABC-type cobalamin/Fe3+-siderophores transport system ATPase subunit